MIGTLIVFLIVLAILIISHELGHFVAAKLFGLKVEEFGLGFPPRLLKFKKGETTYSLNAVPLGGFVSILGENLPDEVETNDNPRAMYNQPKLLQAAVLAAGVAANMVLAWLLISFALSLGVPATANNLPSGLKLGSTQPMITTVLPDSPAAAAGLKAGDVIASFPTVEEVQKFIAGQEGREVVLNYTRGNDKIIRSVALTPIKGIGSESDKVAIGVALDMVGQAKAPWPANLGSGFKLTVDLTKASLVGLWQVFKGSLFEGQSLVAGVVGPVGLASLVGDARSIGFSYLLFFMAFISINLAIFNLIPFPALDGGRLLFLVIEAVKGSRLPAKAANAVNLIGFSLLILFILIVTFHDITRLL